MTDEGHVVLAEQETSGLRYQLVVTRVDADSLNLPDGTDLLILQPRVVVTKT
jgi:hypothetical protein